MNVSTLDQMANHLEFLGYKIEKRDAKTCIICKHDDAALPNLIINQSKNRIDFTWISATFTFQKKYCINKFLYANKMNEKLSTQVHIEQEPDSESGKIVFAMLYAGEYSKKLFSSIIDSFQSSVSTFISEDTDNLFTD